MIKNAIAKTETIATTRTGRYQFKKVLETIDFLLVLLVLGESRTNRRPLTIALCHHAQRSTRGFQNRRYSMLISPVV
jgi:hypothetical protein